MKKLLIIFPLILLLLTGCIRVEDTGDTNNDTITDAPSTVNIESNQTDDTNQTVINEVDAPSTVNIESNQTAFTVKWQKNTKGYGQLEITDNTAVIKNVIAIISTGSRGVDLSCDYTGEDKGLKNYTCEVINADKVGSFSMSFPAEQELLIIERVGDAPESDFEVLSQFLIFASHGKE